QPILLGMGRSCVSTGEGVWLPSLRKGVDEWESMLCSVGKLYVEGAEIDWLGMDRDGRRQKVVLPTYPFQRQRYWIDTATNLDQGTMNEKSSSLVVNLLNQADTVGLTQELIQTEQLTEDEQIFLPKILEILINRHQEYFQPQSNVVVEYYDELVDFENEGESLILNYIPLPTIIRDFSWLLEITSEKKYAKLIKIAQQETRKIGWRKVDFGSCKKVLDIGCGHGTDLIDLALKYDSLELCGYTISGAQVELGNRKINEFNLEQRVKILNQDSSKDEFPDNYDLMYGFEVICHIRNKNKLFLNIGNHLNNNGYFVVADFISNASFAIDYDAHSSYLITKQEWLNLLSENHLKVIDYVDISPEVANGLYDSNFQDNLEYVCKKWNFTENTIVGFQSYQNLYKMLRKGLVSYVVLTAQKQNDLPANEIYQLNQQKLETPLYFSDVSFQQLFYEVKWQLQPGNKKQLAKTKDTVVGNWLIFSDTGCVGQELRKLLEKNGDRCFMVFPGKAYKQKEIDSWEINPSHPEDFETLCQQIITNTQGDWKGTIHLWSIETPSSLQLNISDLEQAQQWGCGSVLHLVQAFLKHPNFFSQKLWLVTRGSQPVLSETKAMAVAQTPIWGLGRVLSLEHPQLWGGLLDLDVEASTNEVEMLLEYITDNQGEDHLAFRSGRAYVARLVKQLLPESPPVLLNDDATYLITGGLGALGLQTAQWMVSKGARHLVLVSRTQPSQHKQATISHLQQQGAEVVVAQADVCNPQELSRVFEQVESSMAPIKGIVHAAGVGTINPIEQMELSELEEVMAPKVIGGWILHQLTEDRNLDFFVSFSSISGVWGAAGQAHYAASNHFLDGLAHYRQAKGLPGMSINWGPWSGAGMASEEELKKLSKRGIKPLSPEQGVAVLEQLWTSGMSQITVADVNWSLFKQLYEVGTKRLLLEEIGSYSQDDILSLEQNSHILHQLQKVSNTERKELLTGYIQREINKLLGFSKSKFQDPKLGFFEMGMDSLRVVELRNMLSSNLNYSISTATFFDTSNIQELAEYLINEIFSEEQNPKVDVGDSQNTDVTNKVPPNLETEPEEEIDNAIAEEWKEIQYLLREES
ncbi:SDR family NAD(P)-dependent oxidoreductase, partial [Moorena sp. SIO3H5]|uniref:SDR family NAD(P)-dependent oxidoreductase n=1 Tax=Moorena sp. SIO3H5 TaxID=2607834 RepID=UPI0013B9E489